MTLAGTDTLISKKIWHKSVYMLIMAVPVAPYPVVGRASWEQAFNHYTGADK
jgi:hypothetical protein